MTPAAQNDITTDYNDHVRELQQYLRVIRRERDGETDVPIDGRFGPLTADAVRKSQAESGLPVSGDVDRATWEAIFADAQRIIYLRAQPTPVQGFGMGQAPLNIGDRNDSVLFLQVMPTCRGSKHSAASIRRQQPIPFGCYSNRRDLPTRVSWINPRGMPSPYCIIKGFDLL